MGLWEEVAEPEAQDAARVTGQRDEAEGDGDTSGDDGAGRRADDAVALDPQCVRDRRAPGEDVGRGAGAVDHDDAEEEVEDVRADEQVHRHPCVTNSAEDGGELKELYLGESAADAERERARELVSWDLTQRQLCDLELLLNGGFSPLEGFLSRAAYESVVDAAGEVVTPYAPFEALRVRTTLTRDLTFSRTTVRQMGARHTSSDETLSASKSTS